MQCIGNIWDEPRAIPATQQCYVWFACCVSTVDHDRSLSPHRLGSPLPPFSTSRIPAPETTSSPLANRGAGAEPPANLPNLSIVSQLQNDFLVSRSSQPPPRTLSCGTTSTVVVFEKKQLQYSQIRLSGHESPNTA